MKGDYTDKQTAILHNTNWLETNEAKYSRMV